MSLEKLENEEILQNEIEKIKQIDHKNFVRYFEAKILPINRPFLLLEDINVNIFFYSFRVISILIDLFIFTG